MLSPHCLYAKRAWEDFGPRVRNLLQGFYASVHHLSTKEVQLFFDYCVASAVAAS